MSAYTFFIKQNDRRPTLRVQLLNADETPLDLTSADSITLTLRRGSEVKLNKGACQVSSPTTGYVEYEWQGGTTDTVGTFKGEFEITWATGFTQTMPEDDYIKVVVKDDLS